jgi:hypothetical protein
MIEKILRNDVRGDLGHIENHGGKRIVFLFRLVFREGEEFLLEHLLAEVLVVRHFEIRGGGGGLREREK